MKVSVVYVYVLIALLIVSLIALSMLLTMRDEPAREQQQTEKIIIIRQDVPVQMNNSTLQPNPTTNPKYPSRHDKEYQLLGTLSCTERGLILPLFGRRINSDRWQYYTTTDNDRLIRLDVTYNKQSCTDIIGCNEIYNNEAVYVPQYEAEFKASLYQYRLPEI